MTTERQADDGHRRARNSRSHRRMLKEQYERFVRLDPHFADLWKTYVGGLFRRDQLDTRTRLLLLVAQHTMRQESSSLAGAVEAAIDDEVDLREVLEVILQCWVYGGERSVITGFEVFVDVVEAAGLLDDVAARGLPRDATTAGRTLEDEMEQWAAEDRDDPRMPDLLEAYDWRGISDAVRRRPRSLINNLSLLDAVDGEFLELWLGVVYGGMLARQTLDDRTRCLAIVASCLAVGDTFQYPRHMQAALRAGATPAELLEVVFQSCHVLGHPLPLGRAINDLLLLVDELGRLDELVSDPAKRERIRKVRDARIAMRRTVADLKTADVGLDG